MNKKIVYPVIYINLDRSVDRKLHIEEQFKKYGIKNFTRIKAIDKSELYLI